MYYRVVGIDKDGSATYSKIFALALTSNQHPVSIFPNPAKDKVTFRFAPAIGKGTVVILSTVGKVVYRAVIDVQSGKAILSIGNLAKGVYNFQLITNHTIQLQKLVVE